MDIQAENLEAFEKERARLMEGAAGQFVVFAEGRCLGVFDSEQEGARAAVVDHGLHRFLLRQVTADDRAYAMSATKRVVLE